MAANDSVAGNMAALPTPGPDGDAAHGRAVLALRRFGLGPRPGDIERILADPHAALLSELDDKQIAWIDDAGATDTPSMFRLIRQDQMARQQQRQQATAAATPSPTPASVPPGSTKAAAARPASPATAMGGMAAAGGMMAGDAGMAGTAMATAMPAGKPARRPPSNAQEFYLTEIGLRLDKARQQNVGYVERLVAFWANHFAVQADKDEQLRGLAGSFEREAIRPYVLGRFEDMLVAVTQHPAMLLSLDNVGSIGPNSPAGKRQDRGINENHARELMELHTVGVDAGYSQADVTSFAKVLTGWTFGRDLHKADAGSFDFQPYWHEPGDFSVMGKLYKADAQYPAGNVGQGLAVLHDLAHHKATARHIATQLASHFVADNPPPALVDRLAETFQKSGGDLKAVSRMLVTSDEAWQGDGKFVTPQQFLFAAVRALDLDLEPQRAVQFLNLLGQPMWNPPSPQGFHDDKATWLAPDAMTTRLDIADRLGQMAKSTAESRALVDQVLSPAASPETRMAVTRAETRPQAIALLLMSPEFQWR